MSRLSNRLVLRGTTVALPERPIPYTLDKSRIDFGDGAAGVRALPTAGTAGRSPRDIRTVRSRLGTSSSPTIPLSEHERTAPSFTNAVFAADGALEIDFPVPNPDRTVRVWLYDVCGTERALAFKTRPKDGRLKLRIGPEHWGNDGVRRPGWILVEQGAWRYPDDPGLNSRETRLGLWHLDGERFARLVR